MEASAKLWLPSFAARTKERSPGCCWNRAFCWRSSRSNAATVLRDAAAAYKVDTDAIALKVKQEFVAEKKSRKIAPPAAKAGKKVA